MADYENRQVPEGINVSPTHPLKEFALLLGGVSAVVVVAVLALALVAGYLVRYIPFAHEKALLSAVDTHWLTAQQSVEGTRKQAYLQALAAHLAQAMDLPADMTIQVHYVDDPTVNAMAFLGGNMVVFQGLIDAVDSENALAMVLAHEIAHIRHRHPIIAMGRGFTVVLALSAIAGVGDDLIQRWLGSMGVLPVLAFSRSQESEADNDALLALKNSYGHVGGAAAFFEYVAKAAEHGHLPDSPTVFNTHPGNAERIEQIRAYSASLPTRDVPLVPLPEFLK